jgi:hypothetical protein
MTKNTPIWLKFTEEVHHKEVIINLFSIETFKKTQMERYVGDSELEKQTFYGIEFHLTCSENFINKEYYFDSPRKRDAVLEYLYQFVQIIDFEFVAK